MSNLADLGRYPRLADVEKTFADVHINDSYYEAIKWAKELGIAKGTDAKVLGADKNLTVGEFLSYLQKYDKIKRLWLCKVH